MKHHFTSYLLPCGVAVSLLFGHTVPPAFGQGVPARITVLVTDGEGIGVTARQRPARDPSVKVEDDDHHPVFGAVVAFALPVSGPSGEFSNGSKNLTVTTDQNGVAVARGLRVNDIPGKLQIYVTASYRGLIARTSISQSITAVPGTKVKTPERHASKSGGTWKWVVLGVAAAGGAGAGIYFGRQSSPTPISISTGSVVFGNPR
jgi:hypothetical protein